MELRAGTILVAVLLLILLNEFAIAELEKGAGERIQKAPHRNLGSEVIDGSGEEGGFQGFDQRKIDGGRVSVYTVGWFTLAMAAATGLGAIPFFFVEFEPEWAGVCNGLAAGVMLAASFGLVQERQAYGGGNWVVMGILTGGLLIWLCKKSCGMKLLRKRDNPGYKYTLAMMGYTDEYESIVLEVTYNYGVTEYTKGNAYAQVAISTEHVYKSAEVVELVTKELGEKITRQPGPIPGINTKVTSFLDPNCWKTS